MYLVDNALQLSIWVFQDSWPRRQATANLTNYLLLTKQSLCMPMTR